jgi:hypothetical protein
MGQPITAIQTTSSRPGTVRFEINRTLTGMGHERYLATEVIEDDRPPDRLARALFEHDGVQAVHIYANVITIELSHGVDMAALQETVEQLYIYYRPGVEVVVPEGVAAD